MWQGIKTLTGYKHSYTATNSTDHTLPDSLNYFFSCFDHRIAAETHLALPGKVNAIQLGQHEDRSTLHRVNVRKAAGPDGSWHDFQGLCRPASRGFHHHLHLATTICSPHLPEVCNHHPSHKEKYSELP